MKLRRLRPLSACTQLLVVLRDRKRDGASLATITAEFPGGPISTARASALLFSARSAGRVRFSPRSGGLFFITELGLRNLETILAARERWRINREARARGIAKLLSQGDIAA